MTEASNKITGGCLCGAIRYESDQPPFRTGYCHCCMCRKGLGNVFGTAAFFKHDHFRFVSEEPSWYASSGSVKRGFCARCGSPIAYQHRDCEHIAIWVGSLDRPDAFEPQVHWYSDSKIPWVDIHPGLPDATTDLASYRNEMMEREGR